jgi:uncharacterized membrane protein YtjA (UPF0391 family)
MRIGIAHDLPVELENETQDAMRGRMNGAEIEREASFRVQAHAPTSLPPSAACARSAEIPGAGSKRFAVRNVNRPGRDRHREEYVGNLLYWAVVFLVVGIIAALFGFGGAAGTAVEGARILFWVAIVLFVISLIGGFVRGRGV